MFHRIYVHHYVALFIIVVSVVASVVIICSSDRQDTPCAEYADWSIQSVPARCASYFNGKGTP